jgi:hypothetical protein
MRRSKMLIAIAAMLEGLAPTARAGGETGAGDRAAVIEFLKESVIGRTVATPRMTWNRYGNKTEADIEEQSVIDNLAETARGFRFDLTFVTKGTFYDLDAEGRRILPGRPWSGTSVARYEIGERASTGRLTGFSYTLSTTNKQRRPDGTCWLVTAMRVVDGKLILEETLATYGDSPGPGGTYRPISADSKVVFSIVGGRLHEESDALTFDVDPDTLKRSPGRDKPLKVVWDEVADR